MVVHRPTQGPTRPDWGLTPTFPNLNSNRPSEKSTVSVLTPDVQTEVHMSVHTQVPTRLNEGLVALPNLNPISR